MSMNSFLWNVEHCGSPCVCVRVCVCTLQRNRIKYKIITESILKADSLVTGTNEI